jgi:hypothetical protein
MKTRNIFLGLIIVLFSLPTSAQTLHIYGGRNHDVYLGCLNCSDFNHKSIWNEYGDYGSVYSEYSIWNEYGDYGDEYSDYSPWNSYADNPPVLVDIYGGFYGYLTTNKYKYNRADFKLARILYQFHEDISEDISAWHEAIFEN